MAQRPQGIDASTGRAELRAARDEGRGLLVAVALFSVCANLLMLTGPIFMLQVYDRVLASRSVETLAALFGLMTGLFLLMGVIDAARARVVSRVGARFQTALESRVFLAVQRRIAVLPGDAMAVQGQRDLESVQRLFGSPVLMALFDMPFAPLFLLAVFVFHPWLGYLSLFGAAVLVAVTAANQQLTRDAVSRTAATTLRAERLSEQLREEAEAVQALGMRKATFSRWHALRQEALALALRAGDVGSTFAGLTRTFRLYLQSAMLALGAWLVLRGELTAGAMIASSILMGRALAPVEQAVGGWAIVQRAHEGWRRLAALFSTTPPEAARTALPRPEALLEVSGLSVVPPGKVTPTLRGVAFTLRPGAALGVIGNSGSGKSTLARALTGLWRPAAGQIRLGGATLDQYDADVLGGLIGYLPQKVALFDGTIAENIARMSAEFDPAAVVEAAKRAAAFDLILSLPEGLDTRVGPGGGRLSGGQIQRIGLARALYGNPLLLVLDEPNSALDNDGTTALNTAVATVKAQGGAVIIMTHRPAAIVGCDQLLVLRDGVQAALGPRDEVLRALVANAGQITAPGRAGGVA